MRELLEAASEVVVLLRTDDPLQVFEGALDRLEDAIAKAQECD